jgi:hypothetical protein
MLLAGLHSNRACAVRNATAWSGKHTHHVLPLAAAAAAAAAAFRRWSLATRLVTPPRVRSAGRRHGKAAGRMTTKAPMAPLLLVPPVALPSPPVALSPLALTMMWAG